MSIAADAPALRYRMMRSSDVPELLALWRATGWPAITAGQWHARVRRGPYGDSIVVVAEDDLGVAGQIVLGRSRMRIDERVVDAVRPSAAVLRPDRRGAVTRTRDNPVRALWVTGHRAAAAAGAHVSYAMVNPALRSFAARLAEDATGFALVDHESVTLPVSTAPRGALRGRRTGPPGDEFDELWSAATAQLPVDCGVVRSAAWLRSRRGGNVLVAARDRAGALRGYGLVRRSDGLLVDVLAEDADLLPDVVRATMHWVARHLELTELRALASPRFRDAFAGLDARPHDYVFTLMCHPLAEREDSVSLHADRWYVTGGD